MSVASIVADPVVSHVLSVLGGAVVSSLLAKLRQLESAVVADLAVAKARLVALEKSASDEVVALKSRVSDLETSIALHAKAEASKVLVEVGKVEQKVV